MKLTIEQALQQGIAAQKEGKLQDAERLYRAILQSQPLHPDANHNLGVLAVSVNKAEAALSLFKTALEANPKIEQFWLSYIDALIKEQQFDSAKQIIEQAKKQDVAEEKLNVLEAQLASINKQETVVSLSPSQEQLSNLLEYYQNGRLNDAEKLAVYITNEFPKHQLGWKVLGAVLGSTGRESEAVDANQTAVALSPQDAEAHNNLGTMFQELGRLDEALASYNQAMALKPDYGDAVYNRSLLLFDKGQYEAALRDADACILKKSRVRSLISLYALRRMDEIYKRIEIQSKVDGEDIRIAAFAAFISGLEKKPTAYKFCPNPIDFIHIANLSSHVNDTVAYVEGIIKELSKIETMWEPYGKTTIRGFQSRTGMNLFQNPTGKIAQLKSIIINEIEAYYSKFRTEKCLYIQKFPTIRNFFGWHVILKEQGFQNPHIHTSGWLSGVIYLRVVPSLGKNEGAIEFSLNGKCYHDVNSHSLTFQPGVGDIIFFPSSLHHRTIPFTTNTDRIVVSFDLIPRDAKEAKH
jgi:tetratricopeptide (TPR) repeat protein